MQTSIQARLSTPSRTPLIESIGETLPGKIFLAVSATAFVAVCAHVSFPLPFTPVPLTLQDFAVILVGMVLGPVAGCYAMALYLLEGAVGLPVFNPQGLGGVAQLIGPTAGYLLSYPLAAAAAGLAGATRRTNTSNFTSAAVSAIVATIIIFACGAGWIAHTRYLTASATWYVAVAPFLFGAGAKIVAAAIVFSSTRRWIRS